MVKKKKEEKGNFFQENNYAIVKRAVTPDVASFAYAYFQNKRVKNTIFLSDNFLLFIILYNL